MCSTWGGWLLTLQGITVTYVKIHFMLQFAPPHLSAPDPVYYLGQPSRKFRTAFNELFSQVGRVLGADNRTAYAEADKVWLFERRLAEVGMYTSINFRHYAIMHISILVFRG